MQPTKSVEEIIAAIESYKLMSSKDVATMRARWFRPDRKQANDPEEFRRWLVLNRYLTEFVAKVLAGRKADQLVLNQYRIIDQLISGPMAGAYVAIDPLDQRVAIEVLSASCAADPSALHAFQRAAGKAIQVQHPNVGRILDTGEAHGFHYLVKEYFEGPTLEDILERRGKLPYQQAARLMALALAGVEALHGHGVPAGDLTADCVLLAPAGHGAANQRTVKILHAGVGRRLFDETAIGRSISLVQGIPDVLELAASCTFEVGEAGAPNPPEDIFRLGCLFYRCVTSQAPYREKEPARSARPATPVAQAAPDVPDMLGQIIDEMIDPDPAKRPQKAAHVAKSLRVFLAADEQAREVREEEYIAHPAQHVAAARGEDESPAEEEEEEPQEEADAEPIGPRRRTRRAPAENEGVWGKVVALWDEVQPQVRDLLFLASGALGMLFLIFMAEVLSGLTVTFVAGLFTGAAVSYFVEMFVRWRRERRLKAPDV
jgi:hypothetical protein